MSDVLLQPAGSAPVQVTNYDLSMDMDFQRLKFGGTVRIKLSTEQDVVLNSVGLNILSVVANEKNLRFRQSEEDLTIETGSFAWHIGGKLHGFDSRFLGWNLQSPLRPYAHCDYTFRGSPS